MSNSKTADAGTQENTSKVWSAAWLGMSQIGCPDISRFSGHTGRVRGTRPGTRGTCPQNGVPEALKNEDTGHENPRLRDTKDTLTNLSILPWLLHQRENSAFCIQYGRLFRIVIHNVC